MRKIFESQFIGFRVAFVFLATLAGCAHNPPLQEHPLDIDKIVEQVNGSLLAAADANTKPNLPIRSVQLDLQVGIAKSANLQLPINLVVLSGNAGEQAVHHISVSFIPDTKVSSATVTSSSRQFPGLTEAIRAIYAAGARPSSGFILKSGSIKVECTLSTEANGNVSVLGLVPIQLGTSYSGQTVQTVTLNFGDEVSSSNSNFNSSSVSGPDLSSDLGSTSKPAPKAAASKPDVTEHEPEEPKP